MATGISTFLFRLGCMLVVGCVSLSAAFSADVVVRLQDGRSVSGTIDSRTDDLRLWLHAVEPSIVASSSFVWSDVRSARYDGKQLTAAELRSLATKVRTKIDVERFERRRPTVPADTAELPVTRRVGSMQIEATPANWDKDPEDDGLLVRINPLTSAGRMRPVDGRLVLKLFGRVNQPSLNRRHFPELTRNSVRVRLSDFGPDGAVYKFPFRNFHPEKNLDIDPFGLLTGRLVVAGQGTFDASDANVPLRRLSHFRDQLQFHSGNRILRAENSRRLP